MYFKTQQRTSLLTVNEDFAHLRSINKNNELEFTFYYSVNQKDAVASNAIKVNVSVYTRETYLKSLFEKTQLGSIDAKKLVSNILTRAADAKEAILKQQSLTIASKVSDITSFINNESVQKLSDKTATTSGIKKTVLKSIQAVDVKETVDTKPILTQMAHEYITLDKSSGFSEDQTKLMYDMVVRQGIDPSSIFDLGDRSVSSSDAVTGISRRSKLQESQTSPSSRLLNSQLIPTSGNEPPKSTDSVGNESFVHVLSSEVLDVIEVPVDITIPASSLRSETGEEDANIFVKFELVSAKTGLMVDSIVKSVDVSKHAQIYYTPKKPPIVKVSRSDVMSRVNLEIKQVDEGAESVDIYRKVISKASVEPSAYTLLGSYAVKKQEQSLLVQTERPNDSVYVYRVIPIGTTQSFEFTNAIARPKSQRQIKSLALNATPIELGIKVEAQQIPQSVVAVEIVSRNLTTHQSEYTNVGGDIQLIDDAVRTLDYLSVIHTDVTPGNVYEYAARLIYKSGTSDYAGNAVVEFAQPSPGKVDTRVKDLTVTHVNDNGTDTVDVTFSIETTIVDSNLDIVKGLLIKQDMYDLFKGDVEKEREYLKSLIAHNVQRVNVTTGAREDFGTITTGKFSDVELRKNQAIQPLSTKNKYRYEVTTLLRAPETMFEQLTKEKIDPVTKKPYNYMPAKSLHPVTLDRGVIVSFAGLKIRYSKDQMAFGMIGSVESVDVTFDNQRAIVIDASAARFDKFINVITWKIDGDISLVDHFIIMKDVLGVRTLIGKAHSEFTYGNCTYMHRVTRHDEGALSYVIVPIYNDYRVGAPTKTNQVFVERLGSRK